MTSQLSIRVGSTFRNTGGTVVAIEAIHEHPLYDNSTNDYDITVLKLASDLSFSAAVGTIALPSSDYELIPGTMTNVTGWGARAEGSVLTSQLQVVSVPLISLEECRSLYSFYVVSERMVCAGFPEGRKDACQVHAFFSVNIASVLLIAAIYQQGDSGGPLVADSVLVGLVSWGRGCARPCVPGVYSSLPGLRDFVKEITGL